MNILVSAYACEPNKGSEPGLGWNWVLVLNNLGYNVTVITRSNNKESIEQAVSLNPVLANISFVYYDLPDFLLRFKKVYGVYIYYELWQLGILSLLQETIDCSKFDLVHHLTFGVFRQPSHLYKLKRPFVMGPLGGAERAPAELLKRFSLHFRLKELFKEWIDNLFLHRTSLYECLRSSSVIFTRTTDTRNILPLEFQSKAKVVVDIGIHPNDIRSTHKLLSKNKKIEVLFVGRLLYWKGIEIAIKAFYKFNLRFPNSVFTIVGQGGYKKELLPLIHSLHLDGKVLFTGSIPHAEVSEKYNNADIFLFPSLHDAGPNVVLEAAKSALPIVALNLGGVGQILSSEYPSIVTSTSYRFDETVDALSDLLCRLSSDQSFYKLCSQASLDIANCYTWENTVLNSYKIINEVLESEAQLIAG